jgi:hypothetical protein
MVCVQIHSPATLPDYALLCTSWMDVFQPACNLRNLKFVVLLSTEACDFSLTIHSTVRHSCSTTVQRLCERGLIHSAKRCSRNDRLNDGVLSKRMFLLWTPLATDLWNGFKSTIQNTDLLCTRAQYILLLKWTKLQLSIYDAMPMVYRFFQPVLHFSSERDPRSYERKVWKTQ